MSNIQNLTLRYFAGVRGRGQFIRALLSARQVPFTDQGISLNADLSSWRETRKDRSISGDFQKLPTLQNGTIIVNEVLVILDYLDHLLGDVDRRTPEQNLQHAQLRSSSFLDLLTPCINLIWCDIFHPGVDVARTTGIVKGRLEMHLATVDQTLREWDWLSQLAADPSAADALLWESLNAIELTFAGKIPLAAYPTLQQFYQQCPGSEQFEALLTSKPGTLTARPGEAAALELIHQSLA